ncbi:molybdate ABC transporter substrate-binding protein [Phaeobacter gallaeciensis]|uniref:Molybdenum ABC transporter, periplasmic molybdate-binding protein n=1 Tax=Phaeobacter gallaeciensis TaxID=60890 RepID=A0AAD0EEU8_9RHOB|nr:molybdate ABC transporter substrate-binding protein [Phaeobacter gallaeciensis]AHD11645.1 molybdenum ABC transporter, periplasmic molybdate-binding protein [Phaeobacter gallaeciensis DSM 26640]ATE94909.1 molybdenum ABC transporter, periplasmic molybdate-binding protein [Phaeobacter gallaeciensis]ATE99180.1 molybdenum ABC transporter, periplasmic molybdate-binding protein [Phaeobacter gallaeciensis]ATF03573.1 molybdenum ABC transporter, periplasmic molybdate-binding protein [Phaeobacter galla
MQSQHQPERLRRAGPRIGRFLARFAMVLALFLPGSAFGDRLTVFGAASLKTALEQIIEAYETESGTTVDLSLAGSSLLARQLQYGAPADVFISANAAWMDWAQSRDLISAETRIDLLGNSLVLIAPTAALASVPSLSLQDSSTLLAQVQDRPLAMALVEAVPAGIYGKSALQHLGLWDHLQPHVAQTDNVRAALALVARGAAGLGVVYGSDVIGTPAVTVVGRFPPDSHAPITYPAAATHDGEQAIDFLNFLSSPIAKEIFVRQGFTVLVE